jgi:hypothetical protein
MPPETLRRAEAGIGLAVGTAATVSPRTTLRLFGISADAVTGAAALGWRMFGIRTALISGAALRGDQSARNLFLPVQAADQAVFLHAHRSKSVPRRASLMAIATSGAIVALDLLARRAER